MLPTTLSQKIIAGLSVHMMLVTLLCAPPIVNAKETELLKPDPAVIALQESFASLASLARPTVVNISKIYEEKVPQEYEFFFGSPFENFFGMPKTPRQRPHMQKSEGEGSGIIISADGYILTDDHVVHGAESIKVTLSDEKKYTGKVVGEDERTDIAIIKINAGKDLTYARLGDSNKIKVGEWVMAAGSPFGLEKTITSGIISAKRQSLMIEGTMYHDLIQTDAAINRGNSGGPLFNIYGEVVGINTAIYAPTGVFSGVGFAIPINNAKEILSSLIQKGKVVRGWLGIEIRPVDEAIARQFGLSDTSGALVNTVFDKSPAKAVGLLRGDIIRSVNGKKIQSPDDLQTMISNTPPKTMVTLEVMRNKKILTLNLITAETPSEEKLEELGSPSPSGEASTAQWEGMKVTEINAELAQKFNLDENEKGCLVIDVSQGSAADQLGIEQGDLVRSINQVPTPTVKAFEAATAKIKMSEGVVFDVDRQGTLLYLSLSENQ
ncbi:MAG: Do family serine endopeptidase [Endomicrobiales bacterium]